MKQRWNWNLQGFAKEHWKSTICTGPALWAKISAFQNSNQHSQQSEQSVQQPKIHAFHQVEKRSNSVKLSKVFKPILASSNSYLQVGSWDHGIWDVCNSSLLRTWNLSHRCISLFRVFQTQKIHQFTEDATVQHWPFTELNKNNKSMQIMAIWCNLATMHPKSNLDLNFWTKSNAYTV